MKSEGNSDEFTDAVNGKLEKVKTTICISCKMQTNGVKLFLLPTELQLKRQQNCVP